MDEVFGRYRLRGLLGAGGMGQVYRAYDTELDREVAIKVLPAQTSSDPSFEQRFRREARIAAALVEPHIVPIHDSGEINGQLFIAMQLVTGTDVATLLTQRRSLHPAHAVTLIEQAAAALDAAHDAGLIHRDVKPANLLVTPKNFVYLIDFGIAHAPGESRLTGTGAAIGTMAYMAPERLATGDCDHRADIYSLACVLHECLTGEKPFPANGIEQQISAHLHAPRPRPSRTGAPSGFDAVIATGMNVDPQRRYPTASALANAARDALISPQKPSPAINFTATPTPPTPARPEKVAAHTATRLATPTPSRPSPKPKASAPEASTAPRRRRVWVLALTATTALALAVVGVYAYRTVTGHSPAGKTSSLITAGQPAVTATIDVGKGAGGVAVDPAAHTAYTANYFDDTVSVIDTTTNTVTTTIPVGASPYGVAADSATHTAYATNSGDGTVSVIDTTTNTVTTTIPVGNSPWDVAVDATTHTAYTANHHDNTVSVIDTTANAVTATIPVGKGAGGVAVDPAAHAAYVTDYDDGTLSVIDTTTNTVITTIPLGDGPSGVDIDPATHTAYIANYHGRSVSVIDTTTNTVTTTIRVSGTPRDVAVDPSTHTAYATNGGGGATVIDTTTKSVTAAIPVGAGPRGVTIDTTTHTAYIANYDDGTVSVIPPP